MRELSVMSFCCLIKGVGCLFRRIKIAEMDLTSTDSDLCCPFGALLVPAYSVVSAGVVAAKSVVAPVLVDRAFPQICSAVVQGVVIPMVTLLSCYAAKNPTVHLHSVGFWSVLRSMSIKTFSCPIPVSVPIPLTERFKIVGIDDGVLSLRQRDQTVGLVKRLGYCVSFHAVFRHLSSAKGRLLPAAFYHRVTT